MSIELRKSKTFNMVAFGIHQPFQTALIAVILLSWSIKKSKAVGEMGNWCSGPSFRSQLPRRAPHSSQVLKMSAYSSSILISETPPHRFPGTPNGRDSSISGKSIFKTRSRWPNFSIRSSSFSSTSIQKCKINWRVSSKAEEPSSKCLPLQIRKTMGWSLEDWKGRQKEQVSRADLGFDHFLELHNFRFCTGRADVLLWIYFCCELRRESITFTGVG